MDFEWLLSEWLWLQGKSHALEQNVALRKEVESVIERCSELQLTNSSSEQALAESERSVGLLEAQLEELQATHDKEHYQAVTLEKELVSVQRELTESLGMNCKLQQRSSEAEDLVESLTARLKELKGNFSAQSPLPSPKSPNKADQASSDVEKEHKISSILVMYVIVSVVAFLSFRL